ncbi:hypothetical protein NIES4102_26530 [Chondrocystis sp. NIES-4102]|nr:hypothetical protein NIES4102_26530 [Chondrocystis sp. NIES-4102]
MMNFISNIINSACAAVDSTGNTVDRIASMSNPLLKKENESSEDYQRRLEYQKRQNEKNQQFKLDKQKAKREANLEKKQQRQQAKQAKTTSKIELIEAKKSANLEKKQQRQQAKQAPRTKSKTVLKKINCDLD